MSWLKRLFRREQLDRELDKELSYHLDRRVADLVDSGMDEREAARRARLEFGPSGSVAEECRDARGTRWLEEFLQDSRHGLRLLRLSPVFAAVALLSLALGIGATTAIFTLMDRAMIRPMPVREPERLVEIVRFWNDRRTNHNYPHFQELRGALQSFDKMFVYSWLGDTDILIGSESEQARIELASGAFYSTLGIEARTGRVFTEDVDRVPGANPVAVISDEYWQRRFGSDPDIVGRTFRRRETLFTIIGVAPPSGVLFGKRADITLPVSMASEVKGSRNSWLDNSGTHWLDMMGRLKPSVTIAGAQAEMSAVFAGISAAESKSSRDDRRTALILGQRMELKPGGRGFDEWRRHFAKPLLILMGTVVLVLLLSCTNLANLLLARSAARQREIAVRLALGAGRWRVVRQMLAESVPLSLVGGALGVLLAYVIANGLVTMIANGGPREAIDTHPDGRVLAFALLVSLMSCIIFSFAPAWQATRQTLQPVLAEIRAGRWRLGKSLIVWQMCISVLLLIGAGLFGRTLLSIYSEPTGFKAEDVVIFSTNASRLGYSIPQMAGLPQQIMDELRTLPGVRSVSVSNFPPISGGSGWDTSFEVEGHTHSLKESNVSYANAVGPDYFQTYGTPILAGREFDGRDTSKAPLVAVVNQTFARHYFKDASPLGKRLSFAAFRREDRFVIVGVVKDMKYEGIRQQAPRTVYFPMAQIPVGGHTYALRTDTALSVLTPLIDAAVKHSGKELRAERVRRLEDHIAQSLLTERLLATLAGAFGFLALLLAAIGIYGMMAFQVARRRREIGIRMALGAAPGAVMRMVLAQTTRLTLLGCAIGATVGLLLMRVAEGFLYGVRPNDPLTFGAAVLTLLLIALGAAYLPGRSASGANPSITLRTD